MDDLESRVLDEVFDHFLNGSEIFRDRDVLRHDYVPDKLPHRELEVRSIGETVAPALKGCLFSNLLVYGKSGTGKTAVMQYVLSRLTQKADKLDSAMRVCFVNCRLSGTEYRIFSSLSNAIDVDIPFTGLALGEVFDRFRHGLESRRLLLLVVLDEIDAIVKNRGDFLLYELTRINESLHGSKLSLIGISNDLRFKELLDPRVLSTLSEEEMVFNPYNADELRDILMDRSKVAFCDGVLSEGALRLCAALAAAEHGDARRALDLLRVAGELAEREGARSILEDHIRRAEKRIEHDRANEALKSLPTHSKIVLLSVYLLSRTNAKHSITGDIYSVYSELCDEMDLTSLTQRRVAGLISELDVIGLLNTRVVSLGRYGRTKKIRLGFSAKLMGEALHDDERLASLMNYSPKCLTNLAKGSF